MEYIVVGDRKILSFGNKNPPFKKFLQIYVIG